MRNNYYKAGTPSYAKGGIVKASLIVICILAFVAIGIAAIVLPQYTAEEEPVNKQVEAIVVQNNGLIGINANLSGVFVTVKYSDGTTSDFSLNEAIITGLDTSKEQTLENVVLDIGGFKQKVTYNVVSSAKVINYITGQGGVIQGDTVQHVFAGYDATTVVAVPDEGYEFLMWGDGNPNAKRTDKKVSRDMTITATFAKKKYTVVFYYPNGTTASEELVMHNEAATKVPHANQPEMQKYGYVLAGWSEDYSHITADTNIYPIYQKYATDLYLSFTQSIEGVPLGSAKDLKAFYPKGEASIIRLQANAFRTFVGWTVQTYNGTEYLPTIMNDSEGVSYPIDSPNNYVTFSTGRTGATDEYTLTFTPTATTESLYIKANFVYNTSNITFSTMGTMLSSIELPADTPIGELFDVEPELYLNPDTRDDYLNSPECPEYLTVVGYVFKGWYVMGTEIGSTGYPQFVTDQTTFTRPTSLIAFWEKNIYQVVFLQGLNESETFKDLEWTNPETGKSEPYFDDALGGLVLTVYYQDQLGGALTGAFPDTIPYRKHYVGTEGYDKHYVFAGWYIVKEKEKEPDTLVDKTYKVTKSLRIYPKFEVVERVIDFTVMGSGKVVRLENGAETDVPGTFRMASINDYTFKFIAEEGYSITSINIFNGVEQPPILPSADTTTYELTVNSPMFQNISVIVKFSTTLLDIKIINGEPGMYGSIKHENDMEPCTDAEQNISVYSGQNKRIWISAPENHHIKTINVGGKNGMLIDFTSGNAEDSYSYTVSYTLVLANIDEAVTVTIVFDATKLKIEVPDNVENGDISYENSEVTMGSSPTVWVEADEGYYIKSFVVNGIKVDPYNPPAGISISQLESIASRAVDMSPDNASGDGTSAYNDVRVTYYALTFDSIITKKNIQVEFAPVYFYVDVTYEGVGSVNFRRQTVTKDSTLFVTATTSTTYYVYSYSYTNPSANFNEPDYRNTIEITATNVRQDTNIMLQNIQRDIEVNVIFRRCKYIVNFTNKDSGGTSGEYADLSYLSEEIPVTKQLPYTLEMEALTSKQFTVHAKAGYEIESILVQTEIEVRESTPENILGKREDVAFNAKSHALTLDSVESGYSITVVCRIASYKVNLWVANGKPSYTIDGEAVSFKTETLIYGQTYGATVVFDSDRYLEENCLIVSGTSDKVYINYDSGIQITIEIGGVTSNADIVLLLKPVAQTEPQTSYAVVTKTDASKGKLDAYLEIETDDGIKVLTGIENGQVALNQTVIFKTTAFDNYILKYLVINGQIVNVGSSDTYRIENVTSDVYAEAIYEDNVLPLVLDLRNTFGMLSSPVTYFVYGDIITIRIVSATGYKLSYLAIGSRSNQTIFDKTALEPFNANGAARVTDYIIDSSIYSQQQLREGLYVSAEFSPISYTLGLSLQGAGGVGQGYEPGIDKQINYGTVLQIPIAADDNNFISHITVNGISYNPFELLNALVNAAIQKCISGTLEIMVTEDTYIEIGFSPNVYSVTVVPSWGGTTQVRTKDGIYSDGSSLQLYAGTNLEIYMLADKEQGTHISELYINGELIRPEYWKLDLYSPNNNRSITYEYKGPNGSGITGNVHIKAVYEINRYTIAVNLKNKSLNFRTVNTAPSSFGTVTLKGLTPISSNQIYDTDSNLMTVQSYGGIAHGTPIFFSFNPVTSEGYKVDLNTAVITYYDPNDTTSSEAKVIALKPYLLDKDVYMLPSLNFDIESVYVEFVKAKYTCSTLYDFERMGSVYAPEDSSLAIEFSNPYLPGKEVVVETIEDKLYYEAGLAFIVRCVPGEGYRISKFDVNNKDTLGSLKGNNYTGSIKESNLNIVAKYAITTYKITYATNLTEAQINQGLGRIAIYSNGQLIWSPGMSIDDPTKSIPATDGTIVGRYPGYIVVTYNTILNFTAAADFNGNGYKIDYLSINNSFQNIANPDVENSIEYRVNSVTKAQVNFSIHYYNVVINYFEGGMGTVSGSSSVEWDDDRTVILNIYAGYRLTAIKVNGTADAGLLSNARKTTLNDASTQYELEILNIKGNKTLTIETERVPYDLTFDGGFMEEFVVLGVAHKSVTGMVINQGRPEELAFFSQPSAWTNAGPLSSSTIANDPKRYVYSQYRYKDSVTLYFMPIDGYKIKNIAITMKTLKGVVTTLVNTTDSLIVYDSRYGHYYYRINEATGAINVAVNYEIKSYYVEMSTAGGGKITKIELNDDVQSGETVVIPRTVNHYNIITIEFLADYGYHLENLIINGKRLEDVQYEIVAKNVEGVNKVLYWYTTDTSSSSQSARMVIDSNVINGKNNFSVSAEFAINTFAVKTFINGIETDYDDALSLSLSNSKMEYNSNFTLLQDITEGYSITDIAFKNYAGYQIALFTISQPAHVAILKGAKLTFMPTGSYIDHLDYHDTTGNNSVLYVYYNTQINTHTSIVDPYLYEYEKVGDDYSLVADPTAIPTVTKVVSGGTAQVPAYSLNRFYNNIIKDNNAIHNYNVEARFRFFMEPAASDDYVFAGYQVLDNGVWRYISENDTGFILSSSSVSPTGEAILDTIEYTIKSNLVFRAVVYRVYDVTVEIHPEYKWQSGTLSLANFNMKYVQYANLTAQAAFDSGMNPNLPSNSIILADRDGVNDASFTYKIYCGAKLRLTLIDTKASLNPITSTSYYDISYNADGLLTQTSRNYGVANAVAINTDRVVHAYANNNKMHMDVALETQGEAVGNEGGTVKYYIYNESTGQFVIQTIRDNALTMSPNTLVKLEITPKTGYRFDGVYQMESQDNAVNGNQVFIPDSWILLENKLDGTLSITGNETQKTLVARLVENTVIKIKFWKRMKVTSAVNLLYGDTERTIDPSEATGMFEYLKFTNASKEEEYDYEQDVTYTVPNILEDNKWDLRYQFVGFFVNDINSYRQLDSDYPDSNTVTFRLYNYDEVSRPDGVTIVRDPIDGYFKVNVVAKYVLIFNVTFANEYAYDTAGGTVYFNPGYYRAEYTAYNPEVPTYYTESSYLWAKSNESEYAHTDISVQMYAKINSISTGSDNRMLPTSPYNIWGNNNIMLTWSRSLDDNPNAEGFTFTEWQYYAYDGSSWSWQTLPDPNPADLNKPTNVIYQIPVSILFEKSYLNYALEGWSLPVSMHDSDNVYSGTSNIKTVMIRPKFQRKENINIEKIVYTQRYGLPDLSAAVYGPASIEDSGNTFGTYNFYDQVTLKPGSRSGYRFLGWYYSATGLESDYILVTHAEASGEMTATRNYRLLNYSEVNGEVVYGGDLRVRLVKNTVVRAVYIKIWNITVKVYNDSGTTSEMIDSAPILNYFGVANENGLYDAPPTPVPSRSKVMVLQAGEKVMFQMLFAGTGFDPQYDRFHAANVYIGGVLQNWSNTSEAVNSVNMPIQGESSISVMEKAKLVVIANQQKTVELVFRSFGKLQINNIYPKSALILPQSFYNAMATEHASTNNWNQNSVADNGPVDKDSRLGYILITDIPIKKESTATYDGVFSNKLPSMGGSYAFTPTSVSSFNINFSGAIIGTTHEKSQMFTYYNTTAGGSDGMSKLDMPFYIDANNYGEGKVDSPFLISTTNQLKSIDTFIASNGDTAYGVYFKMFNSINVNPLFTGANPYNCLGKTKPFNGIFDGGGYNLYFNGSVTIDASVDSFGIFSRTDEATIKNIRIGQSSSATIYASSNSRVGYLVGKAKDTAITGITTGAGSISIIGNTIVGLIVGEANSGTVISNTTVSCAVGLETGGSDSTLGGIAGRLMENSLVSNCHFNTTLQLEGTKNVGGIAGYVAGSGVAIYGCSTYMPRFGDIAKKAVGGIAGYVGLGRTLSESYIKGEGGTITVYSGVQSTTFNLSSIGNFANYGAGGIAGINDGTLYRCRVTDIPNLVMVGSFCGGIAGANTGTINNCWTSQVYITSSKTQANLGGTYGAIAGYNKGVIQSSSITNTSNADYSFTNCAYAFKSMTYNGNPFQTTGVLAPVASDAGHIYVGGIAGFNDTGSLIISSSLTGIKVLVNRWCYDTVSNYTYTGIVTGYNRSGNYSSTDNSLSNCNARIYLSIRVDGFGNDPSTEAMYAYIGTAYGYNYSGSISVSGSGAAQTRVVGNGSSFSPWFKSGWFSSSTPYSASNYLQGRIICNGSLDRIPAGSNPFSNSGTKTETVRYSWGFKKKTIQQYEGYLRYIA